MGNTLRYPLLVAKRWIWMFVVGAIICGGATYLVSTFLRPVYQASTYLIIEIGAAAHPNITESLQAVPTYAQLVTTPAVLTPVLEQHPGLSMQDLVAMLTIKPQANTQIIELDAQANTPTLAADLANQVSQSFAQYVNTGAPGTVRFIPAQTPTQPVQPRPLEDAGIGAVVGLLLAIILCLFYEWMSNRASSVEQIQELLDAEIMALVPRIPSNARLSEAWQATSEKYHMICASLNLAQVSQPFKLVMFTSALAGEGKSTISSQVAMNLAQAGKQVLLVDLNLHHPVLEQQFHLPRQLGLTNLLARGAKRLHIEQYSQASEVVGLSVLTVGTQSMTSAEFLQALANSQFFTRLKQTAFDYILLDAPPLFGVADTQILLPTLEAVVLVVNAARTPRRVLARVQHALLRTRVLGVIVNQSLWRDYADTHPYVLPQKGARTPLMSERVPERNRPMQRKQFLSPNGSQSAPRSYLGTAQLPKGDLPMQDTQLLAALEPVSDPLHPRVITTGEIEPVNSEIASPYVIRPVLSLSGLPISHNGLTRRALPGEIATPLPPDAMV